MRLFESRGFLGGRATSFPLSPGDGDSEVIDNCQHVLLGCCDNLLDFYARLGVRDKIRFHQEYYFLEPGGRLSTLRRGLLPAPFHLSGSFLSMQCLDLRDKLAIARGLAALARERKTRNDLHSISMLDWLTEKRQTPRAVQRFWRQVLVSAINEELDRMAAAYGFQVFWLGFLSRADGCDMGVPLAPLAELYAKEAWSRMGNVAIHPRAPVDDIDPACGFRVDGERHAADFYIAALPFERLAAIAPSLGIEADRFAHSPIVGIHLWFDRPVAGVPHATLLDRTIQWMFNKSEGRYLQLVVSAARALGTMSRSDVVDLAVRELIEFFPEAGRAKLVRSHVIKEMRATFSAAPGAEALRLGPETDFPNLFVAGDWTRSGWPATMEGAVRSGYLAAEAITRAAGTPLRFLR